jgi:hypothetical protein
LTPPAQRIGVSGGPQGNAVTFKPEVGPTIDRRRSSGGVKTYQVELPPMAPDVYDVFVAFATNTLKDGILPFIWYDPFSRSDRRFKLIQQDPLWTETAVSTDLFTVSFKVMLLS